MRIPSEKCVEGLHCRHKLNFFEILAIIGVSVGVIMAFGSGISLGLRLAAPNNAKANRELMRFFSSRNRR